jgi:hypothetical protein
VREASLRGPAYCAQAAACEVENNPPTTTEAPALAHLLVSLPFADDDPVTSPHLQTNQCSAKLNAYRKTNA